AVAAENEDVAARALDLIQVKYEELPAVVDPFEALQPEAVRIHDERGDVEGNVSMRWDFEHGDVDRAAREARAIVEGDYSSPLSAPGLDQAPPRRAAFHRPRRARHLDGRPLALHVPKARGRHPGARLPRLHLPPPPIRR